ncbi:MAG: hypothetical protein II966_04610 [Lachnospiraceae bacterium]|nr:hypothetical protein [Lachnospiraceae bacterium]
MNIYTGEENFKRIKDNIVFELISFKNNASALGSSIYEPVFDLAKVYIILTFDKGKLPAVTMIDEKMLSSWGITREELKRLADINSERLMPRRIELLKGLFRRNADLDIYICSNPMQYLGAGVMVYRSRPIQDFARKKKMNVLIIPSSIHELLLVEAKDYIGIDRLKDVMQEFNEKTNKHSEVLSSNIYRYMLKNKDIEMMASYKTMFRDYYA